MIRLVGLLEFPCVALYENQAFACPGTRFTWPSDVVKDNALSGAYAQFYEQLIEDQDNVETVEDPRGLLAFSSLSASGEKVVIGAVPKHKVRSQCLTKKRIKAFMKRSKDLAKVIRTNAAGEVSKQGIIHGVVNVNSLILGACEVLEGRRADLASDTYFLKIKKGVFQMRALVLTTSILDPNWSVDSRNESWCSVHPTHLMNIKVFEQDLKDCRLKYDMGACYREVRIDPDFFNAVIINLLSNATKYAKPESTIDISFTSQGSDFLIRWEMTSREIDKSEVSVIVRPGRRGKCTDADGSGLGLALVDKVMRSCGGEFKINAGTADQEGSGYSRNTFILRFPRNRVRVCGL